MAQDGTYAGMKSIRLLNRFCTYTPGRAAQDPVDFLRISDGSAGHQNVNVGPTSGDPAISARAGVPAISHVHARYMQRLNAGARQRCIALHGERTGGETATGSRGRHVTGAGERALSGWNEGRFTLLEWQGGVWVVGNTFLIKHTLPHPRLRPKGKMSQWA